MPKAFTKEFREDVIRVYGEMRGLSHEDFEARGEVLPDLWARRDR